MCFTIHRNDNLCTITIARCCEIISTPDNPPPLPQDLILQLSATPLGHYFEQIYVKCKFPGNRCFDLICKFTNKHKN